MQPNPCPAAVIYQATNGKNQYTISVKIEDDAWSRLPDEQQLMVIAILSNTPISIMNMKGKGNGIKRESDGWTVHTQSNKSLYCDATKADMGKKVFVFNRYAKRPH